MRIVISEFMDEAAVAGLRDWFAVEYDPQLLDRPADLRNLLRTAAALIVRNRTQVNVDLLAAAPQLRVVGRLGAGLDNIDVDTCRARRIEVIPATGANAQAVAEYVIATVMLLLRGAYHATAEVAAGRWPRAALGEGRETAGKTLGIVGFGGIGRLTGRLARALGLHVAAFDPMLPTESAEWREADVVCRTLDELLAAADAVTLHVPLVATTRGLFDAERLKRMRPGAVLVNTSRGGIVDEQALAEALHSGRLGGAALDVFADEPLPAGSPLVDVPRLILTPHIAGVTVESNRRVSSLIADRVAAHLSTS